MKRISLIVLLICLLTSIRLYSQEPLPSGITDDIALAIKTGNSKELAKFFNSTITLTLPGYDNDYSQNHAEIIVKEFFTKNPPKNFSIIHQGASKDGSQYSIGTLETNNSKFRTYFLLKKSGDKFLIHQLRFEPES